MRRPRFAAVIAVLTALLALPVQVDQASSVSGTFGATAAAADSEDPPAGPPGVLPPGGRWSVTLLTGDVFDVHADAEGRVTATGRERTGPFRTVRMPDGDLYMIPLAVTPLMERVLDIELFNVSGLIRQGYDDASLAAVPVIVQRQPGTDVQSTLSTAPDEQPLPSIEAVATEVPKADAQATGELLAELGADASVDVEAESVAGISRVWLDRQVAASSTTAPAQAPPELDTNLSQIGADRAWAAGLDGDGVTVAVLDTGVDAHHPDLAGQVVAAENFSTSQDTLDHVGHGTHVAAVVAGSGAGAGGTRSGVAPAADLVSGKVLDDNGFGSLSSVIAGMQWAAPQSDIVNMSLGAPSQGGDDPLTLAVDALSEQHDTLFVAAAGNQGPLSKSIDTPGTADLALTVGAVDSQDALAEFSGRGPVAGTYELKPEVVAPGVDIVAARAGGTALGAPVDPLYTAVSGTSMAAPHAAGAAAILAQEHPEWTADQLKNGVVGSADPVGGDGYDRGAGRIDIGDGVEAQVRAEQDVIDMSLAHPRTELVTTTLTWSNTGDEAVTLNLATELEDRQGTQIHETSVEPSHLTVPPGATGTTTFSVDGPELDAGLYSGTVVADLAGGDDQDDIRTPIAVHAAGEVVDLTIEATPPRGVTGTPALAFASIVNLDDFALFGQLSFFVDTMTISVPAGRYAVTGDVSTTSEFEDADPDSEVVAQVGDPDVTVTQDMTVDFDGAAAVPFNPTVEDVDTAPPMYSSAALTSIPQAGTGGFGLMTEIYAWHPMPPLQLTPMQADAEVFASSQVYRLQAPHLTADVDGSTLNLTSAHAGQLPDEGQHTLRAVDAGDGTDLSGTEGQLAVVTLPDDVATRAVVTERAAEAATALIAFVDPNRAYLTLDAAYPASWADIATVVAASESATRLLEAATSGEEVTVTVTASPYVYDIATPDANVIDPAPVIHQAEQMQLATLRERFHRDEDGTGSVRERRYHRANLMNLDNQGPLPERRSSYVTPDVTWASVVSGTSVEDDPWDENPNPVPVDGVALSMDGGRSYPPGSSTTLSWLRRPQWPGPVGAPQGPSFCQPSPVRRTADALLVALAPFQDGPDRFGCANPHTSTLTLERNGEVIASEDGNSAELPLPADPGTYRLSYEQTGQGPYRHHSTTTWTFHSEPPTDPSAAQRLSLLVVDYRLPLGTLNQPTGRTATLAVHQVTGTQQQAVASFKFWTSCDDGATWRRAVARPSGDGTYRVNLPRVDEGTSVSLRVDAKDVSGNRIEQTLYDAYAG